MLGLIRLSVVGAACALLTPLPGWAIDFRGSPYRPAPENLVKTCDHYENRSRFKPRSGTVDLEVFLAEGCAEALRSLVVAFDTNPFEAKRARIFLDRLSAFKSTIIAMNIERMFGANPSPRSLPVTATEGRGARLAAPPRVISPAGEYLIAREMGVLAAYRDWRASANFELQAAVQ